jgi:hypothetical protein
MFEGENPARKGKKFEESKGLTVEAGYARRPLNSTLFEALKTMVRRTDGDFVFVESNCQPFRCATFTTACRNAKLHDVTLRILRHTLVW